MPRTTRLGVTERIAYRKSFPYETWGSSAQVLFIDKSFPPYHIQVEGVPLFHNNANRIPIDFHFLPLLHLRTRAKQSKMAPKTSEPPLYNDPQPRSRTVSRSSSSGNSKKPMKSSMKKKKKKASTSKKGGSSVGTKSTSSTSREDYPSTSCRSIDVSSFTSSISSLPSPSLASPSPNHFGSIKSSFSSLTSPATQFGSIKSSMSSLTTSIISPQISQPGGSGGMLVPLNDESPYRHKRGSNSSLMSTSSLGSCSSIGGSSLTSFLSVLLEDEEAEPSEISIVSDNPKPEQRSMQKMRRSFLHKNDKPKCRWDYLTRDSSNREHLDKYRRRSSALGQRSHSFSDSLDGDKGKLRLPSRKSIDSLKDNNHDVYSTLNKKKSSDGMFLRMPVRKTSPTNSKPKSLLSRVNMSDTELLRLPLQADTAPRKPKKNSSTHSRTSTSSRRNKNSDDGSNENNTNGNATWNKQDTKKKTGNQLLNMVLETDNDFSARPPSPLLSPEVAPPKVASLGIKQRKIGDHISKSLLSLDTTTNSDEDEDTYEDLNDSRPVPPPKASSFSKHSRRSSTGSNDSRRSSSSASKQSKGSPSTGSSHSRKSTSSKKTKGSPLMSSSHSRKSTSSSFAKPKSSPSMGSSHSRKSLGSPPTKHQSDSNHSRTSVGSFSSVKSSFRKKGNNGSSSNIVNFYKGSMGSPGSLRVFTRTIPISEDDSVTDSPSSLRGRKTHEKCDSNPPKLPTRSDNKPMSPPFLSIASSPITSPTDSKKKKIFLPNAISPIRSKASVAPMKSKSCLESNSSFDSPSSTHSRKSTHSRTSTHSRRNLSHKSTTTSLSRREQAPSSSDLSQKPKGWYSPFDHN